MMLTDPNYGSGPEINNAARRRRSDDECARVRVDIVFVFGGSCAPPNAHPAM